MFGVQGKADNNEEHTMSINSYANDLHFNGIHIDCKLAPSWTGSKRIGSGMADSCPLAGTIEEFHSHDHDGPLVCECDDFGSQDF
jgi:hypothetical protein